MGRRSASVLIVSFLGIVFLLPLRSYARIYLFDKKLEITGKIEQKTTVKYRMQSWEKGKGKYGYRADGGRMENPASFKTHLHLDALYHLYQSENSLVDIYTLWEWFYDFAPDMSHNIKDGMHARDRNRYQTPHGVEMCRELYLNMVRGPWTVRIGKQMVVWGETGIKRTADVINPLDTRSHMMGVDDWEDFKKGLWMLRAFYQSPLRNELTPEIIWVPNDPKVMDLPPEGSVYNTQYTGGFFSQMQRRWKYDEPKGRGVRDSQGGMRIRGYNWDWDWTVLYYNGFDPAPVCVDWGQRGRRSYWPTTNFGWSSLPIVIKDGLAGFNLWAGEYNVNYLQGDPLPRFPTDRAFRYYRTDNYGATAVKYFNSIDLFGRRIPTKATLRFEFTYKEGVHFNKYIGAGIYGVTKKDIIGYAVEINRDWLPPIITRYNSYRKVSTTFAIFQDWILGFNKHLGLSGYDRGQGDRCSTILNFSASTDWMNQELDTRISVEQAVHSNWGSIWAMIMYAPGDHWRWTLLWRTAWSSAGPFNHKEEPKWTEKDDTLRYLMFKVGYQF